MDGELLIPCVGGGTSWKRVPDPPPLEIVTAEGVLVLDDRDSGDLRYVLVPIDE